LPEKDLQPIVNELVRRSNEIFRRLRALEERNDMFDARVGGLQDNMLRNTDALKERETKVAETVKEMETKILRLENDVSKINKALEKTARKAELKELESTISLFSPLRAAFVTKKEAEELIEEHLKKQESKY